MFVLDAHCHLPETLDPRDLETAFSLGFIDQLWALSVPITHWVGAQDNDEVVLKLARAFPGKVIPFGYLHLAEGPDWVDRQQERGFTGLKAHTPPRPYDDDAFFPIYARAEARRMPIVFHTGQAWTDVLDHYPHAVGHRSRSTDWMHVERLDVLAKAFPSLPIICAHFGWPHCEAAIALAYTHPNVYLDVAGYVSAILDALVRALTVYGIAHKVLLGTDVNLNTGADVRTGLRTWQERVHFWKHLFTYGYPAAAADRPGQTSSAAEGMVGANGRGILESIGSR